MGLGDFHRYRRLAGFFALAGVLLYTTLVPSHVVSQAAALAFGPAQAEPGFEPICHSGVGPAETPAPGKPSAPQKKCPFCTGYAAFMTALAGDCDAGVLDADRASPRLAVFDDGFVQGALRRPHNRGPPLEL